MSNRIQLRRHLCNLKMKKPLFFQKHLNELNNLISKLNSVGVKLKEEEKTAALFSSIQGSWDTWFWISAML